MHRYKNEKNLNKNNEYVEQYWVKEHRQSEKKHAPQKHATYLCRIIATSHFPSQPGLHRSPYAIGDTQIVQTLEICSPKAMDRAAQTPFSGRRPSPDTTRKVQKGAFLLRG